MNLNSLQSKYQRLPFDCNVNHEELFFIPLTACAVSRAVMQIEKQNFHICLEVRKV